MENIQKMETILFPGKDSPYVVYDRTAVHSINGITPDENGDIAIELSEINLEDVALKSDIERLTEEIASVKGSEPAVDDIPKVFFSSALPQTKNDTVMGFRYISKTMDADVFCETKMQGSSSAIYPKKNQTTKLFSDLNCGEKYKIAFRNWGKQNKFCLKANWIDLSHARNVVSARLWGDVVRSRAGFDSLPALMRNSPNYGAVDGFPIKVYAKGVYQGRYTLNIPKDAWMAGMDKDNPYHCILCGENNALDASLFRGPAKIDGSDWSDEVHDTVPENIKTRWNQVIDFVASSSDSDFVTHLNDYIDVESAIDYYLFGLVSCNMDGFGKNQLILTYDGIRWYVSAYDLDSTWGLQQYGAHFFPVEYPRESYQDMVESEGNLLYIRLANLLKDRILERWEELRTGPLSIANIINRFERFTDIAPSDLVAEDYAPTTADGAFTGITLKETNNIQQLRDFAVKRIAYVNRYLGIEAENLWSISDKTKKTGDYVYDPTDAVPINYDEYATGVSSSGYWQYYRGPEVSVHGEDILLTATQNSTYGLAVPVALEPGAEYLISYDYERTNAKVPGCALMYYDSDGKWVSGTFLPRKNMSDEEVEANTAGYVEHEIVAQDYEHAIILFNVGLPAEYDENTTYSVDYTNIRIVKNE